MVCSLVGFSLTIRLRRLVITSRLTSKGYLKYDNFFHYCDGSLVRFRTGDIYGYVEADRLVWGRKEDYIQVRCICETQNVLSICPQMSSGEPLELSKNRCPSVARSCVVGNNFLRTSSQVVCAIIEPVRDEGSSFSDSHLTEILRTIAVANRGLAQPLCISWSRDSQCGPANPFDEEGLFSGKSWRESSKSNWEIC